MIVRFPNLTEAAQVVSAIQALINCPLGAAFRRGDMKAVIARTSEREPVLYFSEGACIASRIAGIRIPRSTRSVELEDGYHSLLVVRDEHDDTDAPVTQNESGPPRVMIVEDHRDTALMMSELLGSWGLAVAVAATGAEAVEIARHFKPRVVLLDLGLPDRHGYWVAQQMMQDTRARMSFVAVTGWSHASGAASGIAHHLVKPVDPADLKTILDGILAEQRVH